MHIVYISREYPPSHRGGGIASYLKIVAEGFAARGHEVTVVAASDDTRTESDEVVNGVRIIRLSGGDFFINGCEPEAGLKAKSRFLYRFHSYRKKIREAVRNLKNVDIIEVAEYGAEGLYVNDLGIPVVYRLHTPSLLDHKNFTIQRPSLSNFMYYYGGRKELQLLRHSARHITSCSTSLKEWVGRYAGVDTSDIRVIYNPLQRDFLNAPSKSMPSDSKMVFFAGTVCDWKGASDLIESCRMLNERGVSVSLKMAGKTGAYGDALKERYKDCTWLHIMGKLPQGELKQLYASASVVCFPSWWENMPMVCIEAMSVGAVVIGSNSGGMSEIIEDGVSGFLLRPQSPELWAEKIEQVMHLDTDTRNRISIAARDRIKRVFSLDGILDQTEEYFRQTLSE